MKKVIIILILLGEIGFASAQSLPQDSINCYIKKLSWESLVLKTTYVSQLVLSKEAEKILSAKSQETADRLLSEISNKKKTVVIHMILSKMFEPENPGLAQSFTYKNDAVSIVNYSYNTLIWQYHVGEEKYSITQEEVKRIKEYWEKKLAQWRSNV